MTSQRTTTTTTTTTSQTRFSLPALSRSTQTSRPAHVLPSCCWESQSVTEKIEKRQTDRQPDRQSDTQKASEKERMNESTTLAVGIYAKKKKFHLLTINEQITAYKHLNT